MKHTWGILVVLVLAVLQAQAHAAGHRLLVSGCGYGKVAILDAEGRVEWKFDEKLETSDAWLLDSGHIVFAYKFGVREVKPDLESGDGGEIIWDYPAEKGFEMHSCQPLDNGRYLVGESSENLSYLTEIDAAGRRHKRIELKNLGGRHSTFRQVRKTPRGTYLVTQQRNGGKALEFSGEGILIKAFPAGRFVAIRLDNGNTLIACGDEHRVIEVSPAGRIVWELTQKEVPGVEFGFTAGLQRLPNGNTVICNWGGHGGARGAAVVEVSPDKKLVWQIKGEHKKISSVFVLDPAGSEGRTLR